LQARVCGLVSDAPVVSIRSVPFPRGSLAGLCVRRSDDPGEPGSVRLDVGSADRQWFVRRWSGAGPMLPGTSTNTAGMLSQARAR